MRRNGRMDGNRDDSRRSGPRRQLIQEVSLFDELGEPVVLESLDLGPRGVYVRSDILFDPGEEMWISMSVPTGPKLVVRGRIAHGQLGDEETPAGMGIEFVDLTAREESWIRHYLCEDSGQESAWNIFVDDQSSPKKNPASSQL